MKLSSPSTRYAPRIRWMIRRDMPEVLAIENGSFEFPWSDEEFIRCLRQRNCTGMVVEQWPSTALKDDSAPILGFMVYELHKTRLHILNIAVHPECRRKGIGLIMVRKLIGKLSAQRRNRIETSVRETNLSAQLFYRTAGFKCVDNHPNYYEDTGEDCYSFRYDLAKDRNQLPPVNRIKRFLP